MSKKITRQKALPQTVQVPRHQGTTKRSLRLVETKAEKPKRTTTKGRKYPARPLKPEEIRAMLAVISKRAPTAIRNRALVMVLWHGGLRISEALGLEPGDIDLETGAVYVHKRAKNRKTRTVWLSDEALADLRVWLERRARLGIKGRKPLFCTLQGGELWHTYVRAWLGRMAKRAGIEHRVHPHAFRHACAVRLNDPEAGIREVEIMETLGHSNLSTTHTYLNHIDPRERERKTRGLSW